MTTQSAYKSDKARKKALASYEEILTQWPPVPYEKGMEFPSVPL